jgi:hypothetical protein
MLLQSLITAVNNTAQASGVAPLGQASPPTPPDSINVSAAGEMAHVSVTHNAPLNRGIEYVTEVSTTPSFSPAQTYPYHHGTSRTPPPIPLPTKTGSGSTQNYYFRTVAQYRGSAPSAPVVFGGASNPTPVTMGGSTALSLLPSNGSGTGNSNQSGQGLGKQFTRPPVGPKRSV